MCKTNKKPREVTWAQERAEDRCFEKVRTMIAFVIAGIGVLSLVWYLFERTSSGSMQIYDHALVAALTATTIVAGARAMEGRDNDSRHRSRRSLSPASQMARSWLSCFIAVAAVLLLAQLTSRIAPSTGNTPGKQTPTTVSGTLKVTSERGTEDIEISGSNAD